MADLKRSAKEKMRPLVVIFLVLSVTSCSSPAHLREDEMGRVVRAARQLVLESGKLRSEEISLLDEEPAVSYYFLARPLADYSVRWRLAGGEAIEVRGRGDLFALEGAIVERKEPIQPPQRNAGSRPFSSDSSVSVSGVG